MVSSPPWSPVYEREQGWIVHRYELLTGNVLRFAARDVRKERAGVHASVSISVNWVSLGWSNFNVEKDEDRVRLSNSAYKHLDSEDHALDRAEFPQNLFKHALDLFSFGLWDEVVGGLLGGEMEGDPEHGSAQPLIEDYVLKDAGTILFGPPGAGKSNTALCMAISCTWGVDTIWKLGDSWRALYINVERSESSMRARLAAANTALGLDPRTPLPFLNARGRSLTDIYEAAQRTFEKERCRWAIYDSISRSGQGSMVLDDVANRIADMLNGLSPTWLAIGHSNRAGEDHTFGSQMFDAAADVTVAVKTQDSRDKRMTGVGLEGVKANDIARPPLRVHVFEWGVDRLVGVRRARPGEFAELESGRRRSLKEEVDDLLKRQGATSPTDVADELGRSRARVAELMSRDSDYVVVKREGHKVLYGLKELTVVP